MADSLQTVVNPGVDKRSRRPGFTRPCFCLGLFRFGNEPIARSRCAFNVSRLKTLRARRDGASLAVWPASIRESAWREPSRVRMDFTVGVNATSLAMRRVPVMADSLLEGMQSTRVRRRAWCCRASAGGDLLLERFRAGEVGAAHALAHRIGEDFLMSGLDARDDGARSVRG